MAAFRTTATTATTLIGLAMSVQAFAAACEEKAPSNAISDALLAELNRNVEKLSLSDAPPVYHLRYHLMTMEQLDAVASMGHLTRRNVDPYQALSVELRVGEPNFDNTGFGGWENGFGTRWLPDRLTARTAVSSAWRLTDQAYKQAVEQYARKKAQFEPPSDYPGDYVLTGASVADCGSGPSSQTERLIPLAEQVSAVLATDARVELGQVHIGHEVGSHWILDNEGTRVRRSRAETSVRALVHVRAADGMLLTDQRLWTTQQASQLPSNEDMQSEARDMLSEVVALTDAKRLKEEYVGPVLFEDAAAIDLFRFLLIPQLEGTPPEVPFDTFFGDLGASASPARLGRRVLPMGWTVVDDPTSQPEHPSAFFYDAEGVPTQTVELVRDGIVRTVLMSRVPRKDLKETNGHARGSLDARLNGRVAQISVQPDKSLSDKKVRKKAQKIAASYGRDYYLVVRRLQEPVTRTHGSGGGFFFGGGNDGAIDLPLPLSLVKMYADGREEVLRGAEFASVQRWVLRDVVAAGEQESGSFMLPGTTGEDLYSPTEGMPTWMSAPSVLIGEMELLPKPPDPRDRPLVPPPVAQSSGG